MTSNQLIINTAVYVHTYVHYKYQELYCVHVRNIYCQFELLSDIQLAHRAQQEAVIRIANMRKEQQQKLVRWTWNWRALDWFCRFLSSISSYCIRTCLSNDFVTYYRSCRYIFASHTYNMRQHFISRPNTFTINESHSLECQLNT